MILTLCGCGDSANGAFSNDSGSKPPSVLPGINKEALLGIDEVSEVTGSDDLQDTESGEVKASNEDGTEANKNADTEKEADDSEILQIQKYIDALFVKELKAAKKEVEQPDDPQKEKAIEKIRDKYEKEYFVADDSCMIAALLYKETGEAKYRKEAEEHLLETAKAVSEGGEVDLIRRRSLYYGMFVYLRTERSTDYKLSESLMKIIMDAANAKAAEDDFGTEVPDELSALTNVHLLFLANLVTQSPEYVRRAEEYMQYTGNASSDFVSYELKQTAYIN